MLMNAPLAPLDPAQPRYGYRPAHAAPPAVSIVTPYFNTGPMFLDTVQSVLCQSLQQWEWIIVNDGSTDQAALRTLLPLRHAGPRICVIDTANQGVSAARNVGVANASAPLVFFLDTDDLLAPTALEELAWTLYSHPRSGFATAWNIAFGVQRFGWPRGFETRYAFFHENMATSLAMVRRSVFDAVGGYDETYTHGLEDYEFWLRCAAAGYWGHDIRRYRLWVRRKAEHEYTGYRWPVRDETAQTLAFRNDMQARYPELFRDGIPALGSDGGLLDTHALMQTTLPFENHLHAGGSRRVLVLLPWIRMGGSDRFALDLIAGLVERGHLVSVALLRQADHTWLDEVQRLTSDVFELASFLQPADVPRFLHYLIQSRQIETVLVSNTLLGYQLLPYLRAQCPNTRFVDYLHMEEEHWRHGGFPRVALEHDGLLDLHIVSSEHLRGWLVERGAAAERVGVCYTNIDASRWQPDEVLRQQVRAELGIDDGMPLVIVAARLVQQKRPRLAATVLRRLRDEGVPFVCVVAGDGQDMPWLRRFVAQHGLRDQVRLLGQVPHQRVRELLLAADVLLLPSDQEGIALILFEALAAGVVPVAADVGGHGELVTPDCGVLIERAAGEEESYVAAMCSLLGDQERRTAMAAAGRARVAEHFAAQHMHECMELLFDHAAMLASTTPRPTVGLPAGIAAANLAVEHHTLEERLRGFAPVRAALALRQSSAWALLPRFGQVGVLLARGDRAMYAVRRKATQALRRFGKGTP